MDTHHYFGRTTLAVGVESKDRIFQNRTTKRAITDGNGAPLTKESVLVVIPYDKDIGPTIKTSTLLVNTVLREEYENLSIDIDAAKDILLKALKEQSGSRRQLDKEISATFTNSEDGFYRALIRIREELKNQNDTPFAKLPYDVLFDDKVLAFLDKKDASVVRLK